MIADETIVRVGDAMLYTWGEARRNGELERVLKASVQAISDERAPPVPGAHSDPTYSRVQACDPIYLEDGSVKAHMRTVMTVETEMAHWRADKYTKLWAVVAEMYYAGPHGTSSAQVARELTRQGVKVSERTVKSIRGQMRRYLVMAIRR